MEGQRFRGFTKCVKTIEEVNLAYAKIKSLYSDARHIICAFRVAGRNFHTHQDFMDDDEHGGGNYLLKLLEDSEIRDRAVFVARSYDGTHIGKRRYKAMFDAVKSALEKSPLNSVNNRHDVLWSSSSSATASAVAPAYQLNRAE